MQIEVYITDDDAELRTTLAGALKLGDYGVHLCNEGGELIDALERSDKPAVVFLDVFMIGQDGIYTIPLLKEIKRSLRLRFITGGDIAIAAMAKQIAEGNGIDTGETLFKPFSMTAFRDVVADDINLLMMKEG